MKELDTDMWAGLLYLQTHNSEKLLHLQSLKTRGDVLQEPIKSWGMEEPPDRSYSCRRTQSHPGSIHLYGYVDDYTTMHSSVQLLMDIWVICRFLFS